MTKSERWTKVIGKKIILDTDIGVDCISTVEKDPVRGAGRYPFFNLEPAGSDRLSGSVSDLSTRQRVCQSLVFQGASNDLS